MIGEVDEDGAAKYGENWYVYCMDNPVNLVDRDGRTPVGTAATILDMEVLALQAAALVVFTRAVQAGYDIEAAYGSLMGFLSQTNSISDVLTGIGLLDVMADVLMGNYASALASYAAINVSAGDTLECISFLTQYVWTTMQTWRLADDGSARQGDASAHRQ